MWNTKRFTGRKKKLWHKKMTDLEQVLTYYGCDRWCFVNHDYKNCFWKQYVEFQLEKLKSKHSTQLNPQYMFPNFCI